MTVCIGAICSDGAECVVAADREVTVGLAMQYEQHERKIDELSDKILVLTAGNALWANGIVDTVRSTAQGKAGLAVSDYATKIRDAYRAEHVQRLEQTILWPRGWTLQTFQADGKQRIPDHIYNTIDQLCWNFGIGATEFLVAGLDKTGAHISHVHYHGANSPGWLDTYDKLGKVAIGTGGQLATTALVNVDQNRSTSLHQTIFDVYRAKRQA